LKSTIIPCPFSNHEFILATLNFDTNCSNISSSINARVLNNKSLDHIQRELDATNFDIAKQFIDIDERWAVIKRIITSVVDKIAPVKKFRLKKRDNHPWVDTELHYHIAVRDKLHEIAVRSETIGSEKNRSNSNEWISFRAQRSLTQRLFRSKMTEYFRDKCCASFKSSKKYWSSYKSFIKTKKSSSAQSISGLNIKGTVYHERSQIADTFNQHFANLGLADRSSLLDSRMSINDNFLQYKRENILIVENSFQFNETNAAEIAEWIKQLDSTSSAGISGIPTKVIKHCATQLSSILADLFNHCLKTCTFPAEFKSAIVNPLFKGKGDATLVDDYRGICCLPPIAKVFERILNRQFVHYFEANNLFCSNQHGFRASHSCETALLSVIDHWKSAIENKKINLALFVDFKKAFDLVNHDLLFLKLFHYGFDNNSLALIRNYFQNRSQVTKIDSYFSSPADILLGAPQGSALSGTWFDIFINDLSFSCKLYSVLFADDTTLSESNSSVEP